MMHDDDVKRIFKGDLCGKCDMAYQCKEKARKAGVVTMCRFYAPKGRVQ